MNSCLRLGMLALAHTLAACAPICPAAAQSTAQFHEVFQLAISEPLTLEVEAPMADVEIFYSHDGEVAITGAAEASNSAKLDDNFFKSALRIELVENHLKLMQIAKSASGESGASIRYRIDVPYRTQVISRVNEGALSISGIMGPVNVTRQTGDIKVSYVSKGLQIKNGSGDISLQVIGEHAEVITGSGNIFCERIPRGVSAETGDGDISLMVVGPSSASVRRGKGRIEIGGARGNITGVTAEGDLHVKAIPRDQWHLSSSSGNIRLELPPSSGFDLDTSTDTGQLQLDRDDLRRANGGNSHFHQSVHGGGARIYAHTVSGNIAVR